MRADQGAERRTNLVCKKPSSAADRGDEISRFIRNSNFSLLGHGETKTNPLTSRSEFITSLCQQAKSVGLLREFTRTSSGFELTVVGDDLYRFLDGCWLEVFVYSAARDAGCFDDVKLDIKIPGVSGTNNLDLAATHAASLVIAECKTEKDLKTEHLDKLASIANLVGGNYVGRLFITSKVMNQHDVAQRQSFDAFCGQARNRRVLVVTGDLLRKLTGILKQEVDRPTYARE